MGYIPILPQIIFLLVWVAGVFFLAQEDGVPPSPVLGRCTYLQAFVGSSVAVWLFVVASYLAC